MTPRRRQPRCFEQGNAIVGQVASDVGISVVAGLPSPSGGTRAVDATRGRGYLPHPSVVTSCARSEPEAASLARWTLRLFRERLRDFL